MQLTKKIAIGVYSDAAFSGVDVCVMTTDGIDVFDEPICISRGYPEELREQLASLRKEEDFVSTDLLKSLEEQITIHAIEAIKEIIALSKKIYPKIDIIGLSGQTVYHNPVHKVNITLMNANLIADTFKCPVVNRFIQSDLAAGGKGGPLLASFYEAITKELEKPLVFVSLGGITAMTYIGGVGELMSFDVGPGNILLDTWVQKKYNQEMDYDGLLGAKGNVDTNLLKRLMKHPYLTQTPPKAADRNEFNDLLDQVDGSSPADGAATLTAFIADALVTAQHFLPAKPVLWILSGGGSLNPTLVLKIKSALNPVRVETANEFGWDKNALSSQGYAFLAVRSLFGLPISFPSTTGVSEPVCGGHIHYPDEEEK